MNALSLLNSFERDFARPLVREMAREKVFPSLMKYDDKNAAWQLTVELAGVTKENVKIDTSEGYLRLTGEKTKGFNTGKFEGLYAIPEGVNEEKIEAVFEDGILNVNIPMPEKKLAKNIQIK